jgi:beta-phosphoglucomutase-like phosphatase (HAD superfamily)
VEAGIRGGFALVIGINRGHNGDAFRQTGAHLVVRDLAELALTNANP